MADLAGWPYWKVISITGQAGAGTDYQVELEIGDSAGGDFHLEGHCTNFPQDIRITDDDGTTLLDHFVEDLTADPIVVKVKVDDNLDSNQSIRVYYGKSGESTDSNIVTTFPDFNDDFEDGNITGWTKDTKTNGTLTADAMAAYTGSYGGKLVVDSGATKAIAYRKVISTNPTTGVFHFMVKSTQDYSWAIFGNSYSSPKRWAYGFGGGNLKYHNGAWVDYTTPFNWAANTWYDIEIIFDETANTFSISIDGNVKGTGLTATGNIAAITGFDIYGSGASGANTVYFDNMFLRKHNSPEPVFSGAGAEQSPTLVPVFIRHNPALTGGMV